MVDPQETDDRINHEQPADRRKDQRQMDGVAQRPYAVADNAGDGEVDHAAIGEFTLAFAAGALAIGDRRHRHAEPAHQAAQKQILVLEGVDGIDRGTVEQKEIGAARLDAHVANGVEQPVEQPRRQPLAHGYITGIVTLRHHDLGAIAPVLDQCRHRFRRMLEVAVHHDRGRALGVTQAGAQRGLVSKIAAESDVAHIRMASRQRADLGQRAVGRTVIDKDDLEAAERAGDFRQPRRDGGDVLRLVMRGKDKRQIGGRARHRSTVS